MFATYEMSIKSPAEAGLEFVMVDVGVQKETTDAQNHIINCMSINM